jgi:hypothetical protein
MWEKALSYAVPDKITAEEKEWALVVRPKLEELNRKAGEIQVKHRKPTRMEYSKKLTQEDMGVLDGTVAYDRVADKDAVDNLKILKGHLRPGLFLTKCRKTFNKDEMTDDLVFVPARIGDKEDTVMYERILPTSPP